MAVVQPCYTEHTSGTDAAATTSRRVCPLRNKLKSSSLYVGDLDKDVSENDLFNLFNEYGPVQSVRICRDPVTKRSLGYAYVNFNTTVDPEAANNAKEKLNYRVVNGKAIRIMWATKNARNRVNSLGNIFVKNLEKTITTRELHDTFAAFGEILSCKVAVDNDGNSKGYGFVQYVDSAAAKMAIKDVNGAQLGESDKVITVTEFLSKEDRGDPKELFTNLYVKNFPDAVKTEDDIKAMFIEFGDISSVALMKGSPDHESGNCFAFVNFRTHEAATAACNALHEKEVDNHKLYVARAQTKEERQELLHRRHEQERSQMAHVMEGRNIYVKNLDPAVDDQSLRAVFSKFGGISSVKVMRDPETKKSRGFGFVCFAKSSCAEVAVSRMQNSQLGGKALHVAFAQPKVLKSHQLQSAINTNDRPEGLAESQYGASQVQHGAGMPLALGGMGYPLGPFTGGGALSDKVQSQKLPVQQGASSPQKVSKMAGLHALGSIIKPRIPMVPMPFGTRSSDNRASGIAGMAGQTGMWAAGHGGAGCMPVQIASHPQPAHLEPQGCDGLSGKSLAARLAYMPHEDQKQQLGEMLYPRLKMMLRPQCRSEEIADKLASKVTGMMLEMSAATVLYVLETETECRVKLDEALEVLHEHGALPAGAVYV